MLSEEVLERVSERLVDRIETVNTNILKKMGANIKEIRKLNATQAHQLAQILKYGGSYEEILKELAKVTSLNERDIKEIFEETAKSNYEFSKQFYDYKGIDYIPYEENYALKSQVDAISNLTANNIKQMMNPSVLGYGNINKETGEVSFSGLQQTYYDLIDEAVLSVSQGKETFPEALTRQLNAIGNGGMKVIYNSTYMNKEGIIINRSRRLDSALRMTMKDALRSLHNENQELFGKQFGADGVEITVHENPAPDHQYMQGRQFSKEEFNKLQVDGIAKDYEGKEIDINTTSKKGVVFHRPVSQYNCYHKTYEIVLGVSSREYTDEQLQEIIDRNDEGFELDGQHYTTYEGTQMQRRLETEIRKAKDTQILARESGDNNLVIKSQQRITNLTSKYKEVSDKAKLPTKLERAKVSGYRRTRVEEKETKEIKVNSKEDLLNKWNDRYKGENIVVKHILKAEPQLIDEQITQVDSLLNKYSFIKRDINQDSTWNALTMQVNTGDIMGEGNYARFFGNHYIEFNEKYFKGKNLLVSEIKDKISKKWWQDIDIDKYSIYPVTHEFGHLLEYKMIEHIEHANGFKGSLMRGDYMLGDLKIYKEISKKVPNIDEYLSGYGKSTPRFEWFAETFTQMELGKETPATKALKEYIDEFIGGNYEYFR